MSVVHRCVPRPIRITYHRVRVCWSSHHTKSSLRVFAYAFGADAQRGTSKTFVSERAIPARREKSPHATSLNGKFLREEVYDLANVGEAERLAVVGFTVTHLLNTNGAPVASAPLSVSPIWTIDATAIHLPPSRAFPRATPGCAGCAKRGWRRVLLGCCSAATRLSSNSAGRRPSPPGVAPGLKVAATAVASIRARMGGALEFSGRWGGPHGRVQLWGAASLCSLDASRSDRNGCRPLGRAACLARLRVAPPAEIARLNAWLQCALGRISTEGLCRD